MTVTLSPERIAVKAPFTMTAQLRAVPGAKWSPTEQAWTFPPASALTLSKIVPDPALLAFAEPPSVTSIPGFRTSLWSHQQRALAFALDRQASMLAVCMGGGKSAITVAAALAWNCSRILNACPLSVVG